MKAYRYNARRRQDRQFNQCGREKNPMQVSFYATNMAYADKYRVVCNEDGEELYECELQVVDIDANLFDMDANFAQLATYDAYIDQQIGTMRADYQANLDAAKTSKDRKLWTRLIAELAGEAEQLTNNLRRIEFQTLSDFELQLSLVAELRTLGYDGYMTKNEIAIF